MHSNWSALHAQLTRSVSRHSGLTAFNDLKSTSDALSRFSDPIGLLDWLHSGTSDADAKNVVLHALLQKAVGRDRAEPMAVELLILALWPGLCVVRHRLRPYSDAATLGVDIMGGITIGIRQADPGRVRSVAATLLRNLERDLRRDLIRNTIPSDADKVPSLVEDYIASAPPDDGQLVVARASSALGADGRLLAVVHIAGFTQRDVARSLGISHDAARKRHQRAVRQLKCLGAV